MSYELSGVVKHVGNVEQKSDKLTIQEIVVETTRDVNGKPYTEQIPVQFKNKSIDKSSKVKQGDNVNVKFDLGGREWNGRYFSSINGWAIDVVGGTQAPPVPQGAADDSQLPF